MKNKLAIVFLIFLGLILYSLTIRGVAGNVQPGQIKDVLDQAARPFELSPERGRFAHVYNLVENKTYALNQQWADAVYPDVGYYNGKFFSFFAPGISYMAMPMYELGKHFNLSQVFTFGFVSLVSILAMLFLFKIARDILNLPVWASLVSVIIFAFGSTAWSYAITLYQHHITVFFMVSSFYAVWKYKQGNPWGWLWAMLVWINYALAISIDYPNAILLLPIMVYLLVVSIKLRKTEEKVSVSLRPAILCTFVFFILISGLHAYHNQFYFGSWKQLSGGLVGYKTIKEKAVLGNRNSQATLTQLQNEKSVVGFFHEDNVPFSFYTLTVAPDRGLFLYAPIFLLALLGMYISRKRLNLEYGVLLALICTNVFLYSSWGDPWGGWAYGPRYLIPSMSILSLFIGIWIASPRFSILKKTTGLMLFAFSSAVALLGALTTNAIPPKVEGVPLHIKYSFLRNLLFLKDGNSGSYVYNTYFKNTTTLTHYFIYIYTAVLVVVILLLFVLPKFEHHEPEHNS